MAQITQIEINDKYFGSIFNNLANSETPVAQGLVKDSVFKFSPTPALEDNTFSDDDRTLKKTELEEILKTLYRDQGKSYASQLWTDLISRISPDGKIDTDKEKADFLNTIQDEKIHFESGGPIVTFTSNKIIVDLKTEEDHFSNKEDLQKALTGLYQRAEATGKLGGSENVSGGILEKGGMIYSYNTIDIGLTVFSVLTTVTFTEDSATIQSHNSSFRGQNPFGPDVFKTSRIVDITSTFGGWTYTKGEGKLHYEQTSTVEAFNIDIPSVTESEGPKAALQAIYDTLSGSAQTGKPVLALINEKYKKVVL